MKQHLVVNMKSQNRLYIMSFLDSRSAEGWELLAVDNSQYIFSREVEYES